MAPRPNPTKRQKKREELLDALMRSTDRSTIFGVARRFSRTHQDAEDALEEACILFLRHFDGDSASHAFAWMKVTTKHAALRIIDRDNTRRRHDAGPDRPDMREEWWQHGLVDPDPPPEEWLENREWLLRRADLLAELKPDERAALIFLGLGYSYLEIRRHKGWSERKVKRCIQEGRERLRELLLTRGEI